MATATPPLPVEQLLARMTPEIASSFTQQQIDSLRAAIRGPARSRHAVDLRFTLPIWRWRFYFVFLIGKDRRALTRRQEAWFRFTELAALVGFLTFSALLGLLILYLVKSALGIDIFPNYSFGIWDWFKANYLTG